MGYIAWNGRATVNNKQQKDVKSSSSGLFWLLCQHLLGGIEETMRKLKLTDLRDQMPGQVLPNFETRGSVHSSLTFYSAFNCHVNFRNNLPRLST